MESISLYLPGIILAHTAFLLAISSPGPNVLAVIGTSMSVGRTSGIFLAMGVAGGSLVWALLTVFGLTALLSVYASAIVIIKVLGGLFLFWLAYKSIKSASTSYDIDVKEISLKNPTKLNFLVRGLTVQLTNPKAVLAWIAIISLGLEQDAPLWVGMVIAIGTFTLSMLIHILYAITFSTPLMVRLYSKARRYVQGALGAFFAFAGFKLLFNNE